MEFAPANESLTFEVTFDQPDLDVGMSVYDDSGSSPFLILGPIAMAHVVANTYRAKFTAQDSKSYIIFKAVYTDDTFDTLDTDYAQGTESIRAELLGGGGGGNTGCGDIIGLVENDVEIIGLVNC